MTDANHEDDQTPITEAEQQPASTEQPTTGEAPAGAGDTGGKEAAKYRRRLRDTEGERDRLAGQVEALQRAEVARLAEAEQIKPAAVWATGTQLADLLAEDGAVDPEKVASALQATRAELGIPDARTLGNYSPREGGGAGGSGDVKPSWSDAFKPQTA